MHQLRLILTVLIFAYAAPTLAQTGRNPAAGMQQSSATFSHAYLRTWSAEGQAAVTEVPQVYAPRTRFYGRMMDHRRLSREKAGFIRRWPLRQYAHRSGTMRIACDAQAGRCMVKSVVDWTTGNPAKGAFSKGASRFEQGIDLSRERPVVYHENGSVIARGGMRGG